MTYKIRAHGVEYNCLGFATEQRLGLPDTLSLVTEAPYGTITPGVDLEVVGLDGTWRVQSITTQVGSKSDVQCERVGFTSPPVIHHRAQSGSIDVELPVDMEGIRTLLGVTPTPQNLVTPPVPPPRVSIRGQRADHVVMDEPVDVAAKNDARIFNLLQQAVSPAPEPPAVPNLPPHARYNDIEHRPRAGDEIVVLQGEQRGWRGVVAPVAIGFKGGVQCVMTKPDGSKVNGGVPVAHRLDTIGKVLEQPPAFDSQEDAEAWLALQDREVRRAYFDNQVIRFERSVRLNRLKGRGKNRKLMSIVEDVTMTGKVVGWMKDGHKTMGIGGHGPAYQVVTMEMPGNEGEPILLWVTPDRILPD